MDDRTIQEYLKKEGAYEGEIDGNLTTDSSRAAIEKVLGKVVKDWNNPRRIIAIKQTILNSLKLGAGSVDGLLGPNTQYAIEKWQEMMREKAGKPANEKPSSKVWPRQSEVPQYYGKVGTSQTLLQLPYPVRLAWQKETVLTKFSVHEKVVDSAFRILSKVKEIYGMEEIRRLGLDLYGGSLNVRKMRGGNTWSMHSWGIAIDWDPDRNQLRWGKDKAEFAKPVYNRWFNTWEEEGWISLGRTRNYDWMHVQAARL